MTHDPYATKQHDPYETPSADLLKPSDEMSYRYVGFWNRFLASIVDQILFLIILAPLIYVLFGQEALINPQYTPGEIFIQYLLPALVIIMFWMYKSATPGKMLIKAKIVDAETGEKPSTLQFVGRYLGYFVSFIPFCLGFLWVAWDSKKQGWHDKLAGTVVIKPK